MNKQSISARSRMVCVAVFLGVAATVAASVQASAAPNPAPIPKVLVIDRNAILQASRVGQDIGRQVKEFSHQAEKDLKGESDSLRSEGQALQQQIAILSADVKNQKIRAFENKQSAFQKKVETRQAQIQGGVLAARQQVEQALGPILQGIMAERGANILLDRNAVVLGTIDIDVTQLAVQRLDQKLPTVKVTLQNPPPQMQQQLQQQQQQQQQGQ